MASLSRDLRRQLEKTIAGENGARQIAEAGAEQSLRRLAVDHHEPHTSLTPDERTLRNQLRAHGRQLGDKRDPQRGTQTITHLKQAVAYEHWHRMLFARFLAENDLLLHPEHGVALSLDEVKELALDLRRDWIEVAAEYAQRMLLREVFRPDDPVLRVALPPEKRLDLERTLNSLPKDVFLADDSLGWVYQFWQRDAKEAVLESEVKIGADELSPVTQLFTEDYMVLFLLENTLGAWWTARRGKSDLPGYAWTYLRLKEDGAPAAGPFDGWPQKAKMLRVLDPSMGSGHFLCFALPILARMREAEEGLSLSEAIAAALRENLFGLELDLRCSQIAAFNLALTAWKLAGTHFELPPLNLACSGVGINAREEDWVRLAGGDLRKQDLMRWFYSLFENAPTLGSLMDPRRVGKPMVEEEMAELLPLLEEALRAEASSDETRELAIAAQGLLASARMLSDQFTLITTNVPYLARGKQSGTLKAHNETFHGDAKADLSTCFVDRALNTCAPGGTVALVTPQNWLFLTTYKVFRDRLLRTQQWEFVVRLGFNAFQIMNWWAANTSMVAISRRPPSVDHSFAGMTVAENRTPQEKASALLDCPVQFPSQSEQLKNPDARIVTDVGNSDGDRLSSYAAVAQGISPGDTTRFTRVFWELPNFGAPWVPLQSSPESTQLFTGLSYAIIEPSHPSLMEAPGFRLCGERAWGKKGIAVAKMSSMPAALYMGVAFDANTPVVSINNEKDLLPIWCYLSSPSFVAEIRKLDQKLDAAVSVFDKVPFDLAAWQAIAAVNYPAGLPKPHSVDPRQWLFDGSPRAGEHPLQVAVARLLGYRWPRQTGSAFLDSPALEADIIDNLADNDGIVCLASVAGEETAADRLRALLQAALGNAYNLRHLINGKRASTLHAWLRDEFFVEHCQLFHDRPFIWHVWDGLRDGFHALLNYHRLDRRKLEKLIYSYLGDWLTRRRQDVQNGVEGADTLLAAAEHLQSELKKILDGEAPYDLFVRWKPLKKQPIGRDPDINDGVRVNIRPWITEARLYKATKPGILRATPNIKYTKDRGKEPTRDPNEFPWFKGSTDRINDCHLRLEEKRRARGLA